MLQADSITTRTDSLTAHVTPIQGDTIAAEADDSATYQGFSVWRIAQQMAGCTPQQLDSAIQANLPHREKVRSTRPDTLCLPGLPGRKPYEAQEDRIVDFDMGYFRDNAMLHTELPYRSRGMSAVPLPYRLWNDDLVTGILLLCLILLVYVFNKTRRQMAQQARDFFFAPKKHTGLFAVETSIEGNARLFIVFQLCLMGGLLTFAYAQYTLDLFLGQVSPRLLLAIYVGCFVAYFVLKRMCYGFVNWVFFSKSQQKVWNDSYSYLISLESFVFFPLALIFIFLGITFEKGIWIFLILLILIKILLGFKTLKIFFPKIHGLFHLFAYLCALELMPMLTLWMSLVFITNSLIIKY